MAELLFVNNAKTTLAVSLGAGDLTLQGAVGGGALFRTIAGGDTFKITLENGAAREIVLCTAHAAAADIFTITRAQEGTTAQSWPVGTVVECRETRGTFELFLQFPAIPATGELIYGSGTRTPSLLAPVAVGSYLRSGGVGAAPLWSTLKLPDGATANRIPYATALNTWGDSGNLTFDGTTFVVAGKVGINHSALGGNSLDVFTGSAGAIAIFQSGGAANGNLMVGINCGTVIGTVDGLKIAGDLSGDLSSVIQNTGRAAQVMRTTGSGDAVSVYEINGGQAWAVGLDNSDGDAFKIAGVSTLGINDFLIMTTTGNVGIGGAPSYRFHMVGNPANTVFMGLVPTTLANLDSVLYVAAPAMTGSAYAASLTGDCTAIWSLYIRNSRNAAGADAKLEAVVAGASAGDPYLFLTVSGATNWGIGVDNDQGDRLVFGLGSPGNFPKLWIETSGILALASPATIAGAGDGDFVLANAKQQRWAKADGSTTLRCLDLDTGNNLNIGRDGGIGALQFGVNSGLQIKSQQSSEALLFVEAAGDFSPAPANCCYVFSKDNGAGKTQLCARFNTGAVQVLATQP